MEDKFGLKLSKHFRGKVIDKEVWSLTGSGESLTKIRTDDARSLREWKIEWGYPLSCIVGIGKELTRVFRKYLTTTFFCSTFLFESYRIEKLRAQLALR